MRHNVFGRNMSRSTDERKRLFRGLVRDLIIHDRIVTTLAKAKAVQSLAEKIVTKAKEGTDVRKRQVFSLIEDTQAVRKLFDEAKTRFTKRNSGYTRIIKLGVRVGDNTEKAQLSFVDEVEKTEVLAPKTADKKEAKAAVEKPAKTEIATAPKKKSVRKTTK